MILRAVVTTGLLLVSPLLWAEDCITSTGGHSDRNGLTSEHGPTAPAILSDTCPHTSLFGIAPVIGGNAVLTSRVESFNDIVNDTWLVAQDLDTGEELWSTQLPINFPDSWWSHVLAIRDGVVYASRAGNANSEYLYALDVADGTEIWHSEETIDSTTTETPAFASNGDIFVGNFTSLRRIDGTDGSTVWDTPRQCPSGDGCEPAVFDDRVYVMEVVSDSGGLAYVVARYDASNGQRLYASLPLRVQLLGINQLGILVGPDGTVYAPLTNNSPGDHSWRWRTRAPPSTRSGVFPSPTCRSQRLRSARTAPSIRIQPTTKWSGSIRQPEESSTPLFRSPGMRRRSFRASPSIRGDACSSPTARSRSGACTRSTPT